MRLPAHKTKIVCTIGPASRSEAVLEQLILQRMNAARLNFTHGTVQGHRENIRRIRAVADRTARSCLILADLAGPKIRIGKLMNDPLLQEKGNEVIENRYIKRKKLYAKETIERRDLLAGRCGLG